MSNIIRIEPVSPAFTITWNIGLYCNFDCMYCPAYWHSKTGPIKTLTELKSNWLEILDKTQHKKLKYKISFTGGEVTANKDFLLFVEWLNAEYSDIISEMGFTTNGSAALKYYQRAINVKSISYISFSTHSEFFNEHKFFTTVADISETARQLNKSVHVNIMDEYWNRDRIQLYIDYCILHNINHSVNVVHYEEKIRDEPLANLNSQKFEF